MNVMVLNTFSDDDRSLEKLVQCLRNCQVASSAEPINLKRLLKFKIGSRNLVDSAQDDVLDLAKSVGTNALSQNNEESNSENNDKSSRESPTSAGTGSVVIEHTDDITIPNVNWYCHNNCWHVSSVAVGMF